MESENERPQIGIYGAGKVGTALARLFVAAGYPVLIAGSPRQSALDLLVGVVAPGAVVADAAHLARESDIIIVAVPFGKADSLPWHEFDGRIVVDAMNYWPPIDGTIDEVDADGRSTSEIIRTRNPAARLVKSFNHLGYHEMEDDALPAGAPLRRALAVAGDDDEAKVAVARIVEAIGFDAVDIGALREGIHLQPGGPIFGRELDRTELERLAHERVTA